VTNVGIKANRHYWAKAALSVILGCWF